jgi:hypothetical protein
VANASVATVIVLQSHPIWIAARRRDRQRQESMRRHPSCVGRPRTSALGRDAAAGGRDFKVCRNSDEPA